MLVGIENNHFGKMSGIRDTCPEFRDTCPDIRKLEISCDEISDTPDFWWEIKVVYVRNESELLHSVDRHFRRLSIKNRSGYSGHFGTHVRNSPDTVKTDDRQKGGVILLEKYKTYVYSASVIPFRKLPNRTKREYFRFLFGLVDLELFESTYTPEKSVRKKFRFFSSSALEFFWAVWNFMTIDGDWKSPNQILYWGERRRSPPSYESHWPY